MYVREFPNCCTATIICQFPTDYELRRVPAKLAEDMLTGVKDYVKGKAKAAKVEGEALLVATLTTKQETVKELLVNMGWECSKPHNKRAHRECDLYLLHYHLAKFQADGIVRPRDAKGRFIKSNPFK